jgi:uncharacterized protein
MAGIDAATGRVLDGFAHVAQSVRDILRTRVGTRLMRRDYGSDIPGMLDRPLNAATVVDATMAVAEALELHEPRFRLRLVEVLARGSNGILSIAVTGTWLPRAHLGDFTAAPDRRFEVAL